MFRFALIGCGNIGRRHAALIAAHGQLVAVCDIVPGRMKELAEQYDCAAYASIVDLLAAQHPDIIVICTPNGLHAEQSILALQSGCHVLVEKPMSLRVTDARRMMEAATIANKALYVVKQNRFNPPVLAVKRALDEGRLGKILSIQLNCFWQRNAAYYHNSWHGSKDMDGGILFTQFSHFIDLLCWMAGDVERVCGFTANLAHQGMTEFADTGVVSLVFAGGAIGGIHYSTNSHGGNSEGSLAILAEKGTVKIGGAYLNTLEYQSIDGYAIENLPPGNAPNDYGTYTGSMSNHDKVYTSMIWELEQDVTTAGNGRDAIKTIETIELIHHSILTITNNH